MPTRALPPLLRSFPIKRERDEANKLGPKKTESQPNRPQNCANVPPADEGNDTEEPDNPKAFTMVRCYIFSIYIVDDAVGNWRSCFAPTIST